MQTKTFDIAGMVCDACVGHVTRALTGLDGVQSAVVTLNDNTAVVTYDPALVTAAQMQETVADEGYEAILRN